MKAALKNESIRGYFNSAQAIADYAAVLLHIKKNISAENSPIIVIGGSYGGSKSLKIHFLDNSQSITFSCFVVNFWSSSFFFLFFRNFAVLAAWFRLKYPHIALGAIASSAPILYFDTIAPQAGYFSIVAKDFKVTP